PPTHRIWKLSALGLTAAALLATTTACTAGDSAAGAAPASKTSSSGSAASAATLSAAGSTASSGAAGKGAASATKSSISTTADITCTDANTDVRVDFAVPPVKDDSRLLLVVTNTSTRPCKLYNYPVVKLNDGHGALLSPISSSKPQTVVVLGAGNEAYAGIIARQTNREVDDLTKNIAVAPRSKVADTTTGEGTLLELPGGGVHTDNMGHVTYWQSTSEAAVEPLFVH
ncbi:DUF4232 domain-containing protein, partial [Streptomyces sp. G-G2]|uniref:DUF4232 domain-containing protein n=1 Tax=Streptomyces sp. G-G2 TaxID=3046201 RepID=UPI0024B8ADCE